MSPGSLVFLIYPSVKYKILPFFKLHLALTQPNAPDLTGAPFQNMSSEMAHTRTFPRLLSKSQGIGNHIQERCCWMLAGCGRAFSIPWSLRCVTILDLAPWKLIRSLWDPGCAVRSACRENKATQSYCCFLCKKGTIIQSVLGQKIQTAVNHTACPMEANLSRVQVMRKGLIFIFWFRPLPSTWL